MFRYNTRVVISEYYKTKKHEFEKIVILRSFS